MTALKFEPPLTHWEQVNPRTQIHERIQFTWSRRFLLGRQFNNQQTTNNNNNVFLFVRRNRIELSNRLHSRLCSLIRRRRAFNQGHWFKPERPNSSQSYIFHSLYLIPLEISVSRGGGEKANICRQIVYVFTRWLPDHHQLYQTLISFAYQLSFVYLSQSPERLNFYTFTNLIYWNWKDFVCLQFFR